MFPNRPFCSAFCWAASFTDERRRLHERVHLHWEGATAAAAATDGRGGGRRGGGRRRARGGHKRASAPAAAAGRRRCRRRNARRGVGRRCSHAGGSGSRGGVAAAAAADAGSCRVRARRGAGGELAASVLSETPARCSRVALAASLSPTIRSARPDHKLLAQCVRACREERRRHITCFLADLCSYWCRITFTSLAV